MKKPIYTLLALLTLSVNLWCQSTCTIESPSIACVGDVITIQFESDEPYDEIRIDAFTIINGTQELALVSNETNSSAEVVFLSGGDSEIVVRFLNNNNLLAICTQNVFVLDEHPIPSLGQLSNFVDDQITCEILDLDIEMFIVCPECPFTWTLNDAPISIDQQTSIDGPLQLINAQLHVEGVGSYEFCQQILKPDSTCYAEDCISIEIVEITDIPEFSLEDESIFCVGSSLSFFNETIVDEEVIYAWEINYDTLQWRYLGEDLEFDFLFPGQYTVSLQYIIEDDNNCISDQSTMVIDISEEPIIPITCSSNDCKDSIITYQAPVNCENFEWVIDETLGKIIADDESGITVEWNEVDHFTVTNIRLNLDDCEESTCGESVREIALFPEQLIIEGAKGVCDRGSEWYETDIIPNGIYTWNIEMTDSIQGIPPSLVKVEDNRALIAYNSYVGSLNINVSVTSPSYNCEVQGSINTISLLVSTNDNLCPGDLFKAKVLPKIEQEIIWTLSNSDVNYTNQQILSGLDDFFAIDINAPGTYDLNVQIPELGFECGDDILITVLDEPTVSLIGPRFVCPGESITYTLEGLGGNDEVEWTIFQNNTSTEITGNEITVVWEEGGMPYNIKVKRSTAVSIDQICESDNFVFEIGDLRNQQIKVTGPEIVCYDGQTTYEIQELPGQYIWEIDPPYMGTIIEGDSTEMITIQWHYAPNTPFATLSTSREVCDSLVTTEIDVFFDAYVPILVAPDTVCQNTPIKIEIQDLQSYEIIEYYLNDSLVRDDAFSHFYSFRDTGLVEVKIDLVKPNECPGVSSVSKMIYVLPKLNFGFTFSGSIKQCPVDSFQNVDISPDFINPNAYYEWVLDGEVIKEGLGSEDVYTFTVTKEMIENLASSLVLNIDAPGLCPGSGLIPLSYKCEEIVCQCLEDVVGSVDYLTPLDCNLASFGGSLDFSTVLDAYWRISLRDSVVIIPINSEEDLVQDSFYFDDDRTLAQVAIRGSCAGGTFLSLCGFIQDELIDSTICEIFIDEQTAKLYTPNYFDEYICNEDLTYDIVLTEASLRFLSPPYSSTVTWKINGEIYEGASIVLENVVGGTPLDIEITQCSLDGEYCCTRTYETTARSTFDPNIILPNGSCENDLWLFDLDVIESEIVSALWDFGDGSGSTLVSTTKGFMDTLAHDISVVVTDDLGCVATAETTVKSFPNIIDGEVIFEGDPCAASVFLTYEELSETTIDSYDWSIFNAPDSATVEVTISGDYSVTVTDIHGCKQELNIGEVIVNESFVGGLKFQEENCGVAVASILASDQYSYVWFVDGEEVSTSNFIQIVNPGEHEIKVVSTSITSNEVCDSIVENLIIYPLPDAPIIKQEKVFCDPYIIELTLQNYPSAIWDIDNILSLDGPSIFVSQNGKYSASVVDENGCFNKSSKTINEVNVPFNQLIDQCIQACREDLDSLAITIPGINYFATNYSWISVDSLGEEFEIINSSGLVSSVQIDSNMYDYVVLEIEKDECLVRSQKIPLDIENCNQPDPPIEIICEPLDTDHESCGLLIYDCLVSEVNGGPKLYYEGSVTLPMDAVLCSEDTLTVSLNNGEITITEVHFESIQGKIMASYAANIVINDADDYTENGTIIKFEFCNEEGEIAYCYEYTLPYRSCGNDFDCLVDYEGVTAGHNQSIDVNYCLNLSEIEQEECTLTEYDVVAILSGDESYKTIYTQTLEGPFDDLHCISINVTAQDFFGGEFNCIELMVDGNCPGISCSEYQCGIFGNGYYTKSSNGNKAVEMDYELTQSIKNDINTLYRPSLEIYPNPSYGQISFEFKNIISKSKTTQNKLIIKNSLGQIIRILDVKDKKKIIENLEDQHPGLFTANWVINGEVISSRRFLLIK